MAFKGKVTINDSLDNAIKKLMDSYKIGYNEVLTRAVALYDSVDNVVNSELGKIQGITFSAVDSEGRIIASYDLTRPDTEKKNEDSPVEGHESPAAPK